MWEPSSLNLSDRRAEDGTVTVSPEWEVRDGSEGETATSWYTVRLVFTDGARVEALAVVRAGRVSIEDVRARPALSLVDLTVLADWIEGPLFDRCGGDLPDADADAREERWSEEECGSRWDAPTRTDAHAPGTVHGPDAAEDVLPAARRARPAWPRGTEGRLLLAEEYRAAQEDGVDPVLAVMWATGHSRRRSLRLIAQARDAGLLTPRHARR
ncbi:DUF6214 family protein [Streptomyces sp. NPDC086091]|uniref:DUF6214 family protein n=1 Tax=Streptomyces sp. NPDC086091 TaxID=3365751 RepID=UPI00382F5695